MHAPACINLGTIHYNQRQFLEAERLYRRPLPSIPNTRSPSSISATCLTSCSVFPKRRSLPLAIRLVPTYADAHYNLALAYRAHRTAPQSPAPLDRLSQAGQCRSVGKPRAQPTAQNPRPRKADHRAPLSPAPRPQHPPHDSRTQNWSKFFKDCHPERSEGPALLHRSARNWVPHPDEVRVGKRETRLSQLCHPGRSEGSAFPRR